MQSYKPQVRAVFALVTSFLVTVCVDVQKVDAASTRQETCTQTPNARPAACFVGEYDLRLAGEAGAYLVLSADRHFEWIFSTPDDKKYAEGRWAAANGTVTLSADQFEPNRSAFEFLSQTPWGEADEYRYRVIRRDAEIERATARCPIFVGDAVSVYEPPAIAEPSAAATMAADAGLTRYNAAKKALEDAVMAALGASVANKERLSQVAMEAQNDFLQARLNLRARYAFAGLSLPPLGEPQLPPACTVARPVTDVPQAQWLRGVGVNIDNVGGRFLVSGFKATLTYANGRTAALTTNTSGLAFAPYDPKAKVTRVTIGFDGQPARTRSFTVAPVSEGVFNFTVDGDILNPPPFTTLRLRSVGRNLVSSGYMAGNYERVAP
jgi:hypothetical protein